MCGIAGFLDAKRPAADQMAAQCRTMARRLRHRGPDDQGVWVDAQAGLGFAQRRLAVMDLSQAGHQPMISSDGNYVLNYNGMIYNANALRVDLQAAGRSFRGYSDTEVILEGCAAWGVKVLTRKLIGMFAFALWDQRRQYLSLVRDRMGIKPLYYGCFGPLFLFGSELSPLCACEGWEREINRDAVAGYLRHNYVPAPLSIYRGIYKLAPGKILSLCSGQEPQIESYWSLDDVLAAGAADPFTGSDDEAIEKLDALLSEAVQQRMISDVPIGAFLSGGIDSSLVVALMQKSSIQPVRSFSIGFHEADFNEADHAACVARHLGTDHTELYVTSAEAMDVIPTLPHLYDEPFADSSQIPTYLLSALTRKHVTVSLSGDGGDEVFAGYNRYFLYQRIEQMGRFLPGLSGLIQKIPPRHLDKLFGLLPKAIRPARAGEKLHKLARILSHQSADYYHQLISQWNEPNQIVLGGYEPRGVLWDPTVSERVPNSIDRMQYWDMLTYLPDDILTKVDRASMAVALEARVPLLDHRVVEFAWTLPRHHKIRKGQGKWLLRRVLERYVPLALTDRPKMGFGVPMDDWLRGSLRNWAGDLLSQNSLRQQALLDPVPIERLWHEHCSGTRNAHTQLWGVLMLQSWLAAQPAGPEER